MTFKATRYEKIFLGLMALLLLIAIIAVCVLFTARKYEGEHSKLERELLLDANKREREARQSYKEWADSTIAYMMKNGNQATVKARSNQPYYRDAQKKIDKVEEQVRQSDLQREFSEFR